MVVPEKFNERKDQRSWKHMHRSDRMMSLHLSRVRKNMSMPEAGGQSSDSMKVGDGSPACE